jgi:crotonobetainyl-CoA:carnitine CoA-transferase CaiB-like acyl-CoA transferase
MGNSFATVVPYSVFPASDRSLSIAVGSEKLWATFCCAIERQDLTDHPDFATNRLRVQNRPALESILADVFRQRPLSEWIEKLTAVGVPCSPVRTFAEVLEHPQTAVRRMFPEMDCPSAGRHRVTGTPVKLSETPGRMRTPAPALGEHTSTVLSELLGVDEREIEKLAELGVVRQGG